MTHEISWALFSAWSAKRTKIAKDRGDVSRSPPPSPWSSGQTRRQTFIHSSVEDLTAFWRLQVFWGSDWKDCLLSDWFNWLRSLNQTGNRSEFSAIAVASHWCFLFNLAMSSGCRVALAARLADHPCRSPPAMQPSAGESSWLLRGPAHLRVCAGGVVEEFYVNCLKLK